MAQRATMLHMNLLGPCDPNGEDEPPRLLDTGEQRAIIHAIHEQHTRFIGITRMSIAFLALILAICFCFVITQEIVNPWSPVSHRYLRYHKYDWHAVLLMEALNVLVLLRIAVMYCTLADVRAYQDPLLPLLGCVVVATVVYFPGTALSYEWEVNWVVSPNTLWLQWSSFFVTFVSWYVEVTIENGQQEINRLKRLTYSFEKP